MTPIFEDYLLRKYPRLLKQYYDSPMETCMCWGVETLDGWLWILDELLGAIQQYIDDGFHDQIEIAQIKEKYGTLRVYVNWADDVVFEMIDAAESLSERVCELCGSMDDAKVRGGGWLVCRCRKCAGEI